jgi:hypothetical protein
MESPELRKCYLAIQNLREAMTHDLSLDEFDQICLENYIALLQITYMEWKRRNIQQPSNRRAA